MSRRMQIFHQLDEKIAEIFLADFHQDRLYIENQPVRKSYSYFKENLIGKLKAGNDLILTTSSTFSRVKDSYQNRDKNNHG